MKFIVVALAALALSGCQTQSEAQLKVWTERVNQITVGMRRAEVERILPPYVAPKSNPELARYGYWIEGTISGGAKGIQYYVSPGYKVTVFYDYTGIPRDATGRALSTDSPDSRVIQPVELSYQPIPPRK